MFEPGGAGYRPPIAKVQIGPHRISGEVGELQIGPEGSVSFEGGAGLKEFFNDLTVRVFERDLRLGEPKRQCEANSSRNVGGLEVYNKAPFHHSAPKIAAGLYTLIALLFPNRELHRL
jgi:hypothetical protein